MKVRIREAKSWHQHGLEWQPPNSDNWYLVRRDDVCLYTGHHGKSHYDIEQEFFNRLLKGETITAEHCRYFRRLHLLLVEYGGGREDGKIGQGNTEMHTLLPDHQHAQHRPEACRPASQLPNLGGENMGKKKQKEKTGYDPKAIREAAETLAGKERAKPTTENSKAKKPTKAKPTTEKPRAPSDNEVLKALKQLGKAGSREVSDKLGIKDPEKGRAYVRNVMNRLAEAGKVKMSKSGKQYSYEAA